MLPQRRHVGTAKGYAACNEFRSRADSFIFTEGIRCCRDTYEGRNGYTPAHRCATVWVRSSSSDLRLQN